MGGRAQVAVRIRALMTTDEITEKGGGSRGWLRKFAAEWLLLFVVICLGLLVDDSRSWGWDESMHVGLPASHMALALEAGEVGEAVDVLLDCNQYPFVYPAFIACAEVLFGASDNPEMFGRSAGRMLWGLGLWGLALLAAELARRESATTRGLAMFFVVGLGLLSPLFMDYSATWFLEVPFASVAIFALLAWIRRARLEGEPGEALRDFQVGALVMLAFFTKFNYGLLLGLGLFLDLVVGCILAMRARRTLPFAISTARLAVPAAIGFTWWFLLPLPGGAEVAATHRSAFMEFLSGNQQLVRTPDAHRLLDWGISLFRTPRTFVAVLFGALLTLPLLKKAPRSIGTIWLVLLAFVVPIATHNFHLDRFLIGPGPFLFLLGALGLARLLTKLVQGHAVLVAAPALLCVLVAAPQLDGAALFDATRGFAELPIGASSEQQKSIAAARDYQMRIVKERSRTSPTRPISTGGLEAGVASKLLDLVATEVKRMESESGTAAKFGWLGISTELSPAALHIGVLARGGNAERLRRDARQVRGDGMPAMCMTFEGVDPGWNDEQLRMWADGFEVIFITTPSDIKARGNRSFIHAYQDRLVGGGGWQAAELGEVSIEVPLKEPLAVQLFALRRQR